MNEFWEKIKMVSEVIREQKEAAEMKKQLDADLDDMVCQNFNQKFLQIKKNLLKTTENLQKLYKLYF